MCTLLRFVRRRRAWAAMMVLAGIVSHATTARAQPVGGIPPLLPPLPWVAQSVALMPQLADALLGVSVRPASYWLRSLPVRSIGLRVTAVHAGTPAAAAGLEPGDIIAFANGRPVATVDQLRSVLAAAGGQVELVVREFRAGSMVPLKVRLAQATAAEGWEHRTAVAGGGRGSLFVPRTTVYTYAEKGIDGNEPVAEVPATELIPRFPWPPPKSSARVVVPARLVHQAGAIESQRDVARRLEAAFRKAGYVELSYYAVPDGFAICTHLEQFNADGTPLPDPPRWSIEVPSPHVFDLSSYLHSLFGAQKGHFRIIVLVVTPRPFSENTASRVTADMARDWVDNGITKLPESYARIPYTDETDCTALIYEFQTSTPEAPVILKDSGINAATHLEKAGIFAGVSQ